MWNQHKQPNMLLRCSSTARTFTSNFYNMKSNVLIINIYLLFRRYPPGIKFPSTAEIHPKRKTKATKTTGRCHQRLHALSMPNSGDSMFWSRITVASNTHFESKPQSALSKQRNPSFLINRTLSWNMQNPFLESESFRKTSRKPTSQSAQLKWSIPSTQVASFSFDVQTQTTSQNKRETPRNRKGPATVKINGNDRRGNQETNRQGKTKREPSA